MLVSDAIPALIGGVSQQPPELRLPSQTETCVNFLLSEKDGLLPRPPMLHVAELSATPLVDMLTHSIQRGVADEYQVVLVDGDLKVYDLAGDEKTVAFPDGKGYLDTGSGTARTALRAATVADFTFITNRTVTVAMSASVSSTRPFEAMAVVYAGGPRTTYGLTLEFLDGSGSYTTSHQTQSGDSDSSAASYHTQVIATNLYNGLNAALTGAGFTVTKDESILYFSHATKDFRITSKDSNNNNHMRVFKTIVQRFSALPGRATNGFEIEVIGEEGTEFDNYYVRYETAGTGSHTGAWKETRGQGITYQLDAATMPHVLVRESDGTFTFKQADWTDREVGDSDSNPDPGFVGRPVDEVFLYRGRLGFLAGESIILSDSTDLFSFFRKTVITDLDDDPIDVVSSGAEVSSLHSAVPFGERLVLFGRRHQLGLGANEVLSARTVTIDLLSQFESLEGVRPVGAGTSLYFLQSAGQFLRLRSMYVTDDGQTFDAEDVSGQAPAYIPRGVFQLTASAGENMVVMASAAQPRRLYLYKFYFDGRTRVQSALSYWELPEGTAVGGVSFVGDTLYVIYTRDSGTFLGAIPLARGAVDEGSAYFTRLDRRIDETSCALLLLAAAPGIPERTKVTLPYDRGATTMLAARAGGDVPEGVVPTILDTGADYITVEGDYTDQPFFVGDQYVSSATLSPVLARTARRGSDTESPVLSGRLQMRYIALHYANSGPFTVTVTPSYREPHEHQFTGRRLGTTQTGEVPIDAGGVFRVPVQCRNTDATIELVVATHLPAAIQALEWEGFLYRRAAGR